MATIPAKQAVKINAVINRIESGLFDANDVDSILIYLRNYAGGRRVFREIADFVAHADSRDRGVICESMTGFSDSMRFFQEYVSSRRSLDIRKPLPAYIYRLFRSQATKADEDVLRQRYRMSHQTLLKKIENNFIFDKKAKQYSLRPEKEGREFFAALEYVLGFIHSKPAFHISEFHQQFRELLTEQKIQINVDRFVSQADRISLALLCILSGTEFVLPEGGTAKCLLSTESHYRILTGQRKTPIGKVTNEPSAFGQLQISGCVKVMVNDKEVVMMFPVIETSLNPCDHCDPSFFEVHSEMNEFGEFSAESINLQPDMALDAEFKLIRAEPNR